MTKILITGGAGFVGVNSAYYFLKKKYRVIIYDNFSRQGSLDNIKWLRLKQRKHLKIIEGGIQRYTKKLQKAVARADVVLHLAAQVAVTNSVSDPRHDFNVNALGTLNILEAARLSGNRPFIIYTSTNKVYGSLTHEKVIEDQTRYRFKNLPHGVDEETPLDFHSPYGCSKGTADQYVRDYFRIYDIPTVVLRQSCIYGAHQMGVEDQGWVAWFLIALTLGKRITIYGNGKQVRDILYIDDLIEAYDRVIKNPQKTRGQIYNLGGGPQNTLSVWQEFKPILEKLFNRTISPIFAKQRPGDQPIFISDIRKAQRDFEWQPAIGVQEGIGRLFQWVQENKSLFQ